MSSSAAKALAIPMRKILWWSAKMTLIMLRLMQFSCRFRLQTTLLNSAASMSQPKNELCRTYRAMKFLPLTDLCAYVSTFTRNWVGAT
jgi:hypothetical protein